MNEAIRTFDITWLEQQVRQCKAGAFNETGYGTQEKRDRYMAAVNAYDAVLRLIEKVSNPGRCKRCGGQTVRNHEDISCLQCGAKHNEKGELMVKHITDNDVKLSRARASKG